MKAELAPVVDVGMVGVTDDGELIVTAFSDQGVVLERVDDGEGLVMEPNAFVAACRELLMPDGRPVREVAGRAFVPDWDGVPPEEQRRAYAFESHVREVLFGTPAVPGESAWSLENEIGEEAEVNERLLRKLEELAGTEFEYAPSTFEAYMDAYKECGVAALARRGRVGRPPDTCELYMECLEEYVANQLSRKGATVQKAKWLREVAEIVRTDERYAGARVPSRATQYRVLDELLERLGVAGTHRKYQQSVSNLPRRTFRKAPALMPGDRVEIDATILNVMVTDGFGRMFRPHCGLSIDTATRTIGSLLVAESIGQPEFASLLLEMMSPKPAARPFAPEAHYNRLGLDAGYLARYLPEAPEGSSEAGVMVVPRAITIDRGKAFDNKWLLRLARNLGFAVEFARPYTPTDKPHVERFFRSLEGVLQELPGYVGIDVRDRGRGLSFEPEELFTMAELETVLKAWVTRVYHHTPHKGLVLAGVSA